MIIEPHILDYPQLQSCEICPRNCAVNRYTNTGFCGAGTDLKLNLHMLHHGEEPCLSGTNGSGTIFFSWCNLRCVFCQNYSLSALGWGSEISEAELATLMLNMQKQGAHNINLVTPTHYTLQIRTALSEAREKGLIIPVVWNSSAYEKPEVLRQLAGLVDVYLPDFKYGHGLYAAKYSQAKDYPEVALEAINEMYSQVGKLRFDAQGLAVKGLMIRILVLPNGLNSGKKVLGLIADRLGTDVQLSIMGQYYPAGDSELYPELQRGITQSEYDQVVNAALELGFSDIYTQEIRSSKLWTPSFQGSSELDVEGRSQVFNPSSGDNQ